MRVALDVRVREAEARWLDAWTSGPERLTWDRPPPQVGDPAPDAILPDHTGSRIRLSDGWQHQPLAVLFWRHFGCSCGRDRAARLRDEIDDYRADGAAVVIIGQGDPERATAYREELGLDVPILCDTEQQAYRAYGLLQGTVPQLLFDAPEEMWAHDRETGRRFQDGRRAKGNPPVDDPWLLPGEFVVGRDGLLRLTYRYQYCEDYPDPRVLRAAIRLT